MLIIRLIEEHILPIPLPARMLRCPVFQIARGRDSMFRAQLLPELRSDYALEVSSATRSWSGQLTYSDFRLVLPTKPIQFARRHADG